jgi:hypothetical protein
MSEMFLGCIPVKKIVIVDNIRFVPTGRTEPVNATAESFDKLKQTNLTEKVLYVYPTSSDFKTKIFTVYYE